MGELVLKGNKPNLQSINKQKIKIIEILTLSFGQDFVVPTHAQKKQLGQVFEWNFYQHIRDKA